MHVAALKQLGNINMTLREQQSMFVWQLAKLFTYAYSQGYELTLGEAWRPQAVADLNALHGTGIKNSLHGLRLAIDLNLYIDGQWQRESSAHAQLGAYWKTLHPLCRWGGDFKPKPDGNHYSMEWEGVK